MSDLSFNPKSSCESGVLRTYRRQVAEGVLQSDPAQMAAAIALDRLALALQERSTTRDGLFSRLTKKKVTPIKGLYLVGEVGRGKTMLMDLFCREVAVTKKRRIHFHAFMQEVLRALHRAQNRETRSIDPVSELAEKIHAQNELLCFDEFQINDMSDAVLVLRLLDKIMAMGTVVVTTSNTAPQDLMKGQKQNRATMKPYLEAFSAYLDVITLEAVRDYRRGRSLDAQTWLVPASEENRAHLRQKFEELTEGHAEPGSVSVGSRRIVVPSCTETIAWFGFDALCGDAHGPADYLALVARFRVIFIDDIPALVPDQFDKARRFINLIDVMYENHTALYACAACMPEALYQTGENAQAFERTTSRLEEMRSSDWQEG